MALASSWALAIPRELVCRTFKRCWFVGLLVVRAWAAESIAIGIFVKKCHLVILSLLSRPLILDRGPLVVTIQIVKVSMVVWLALGTLSQACILTSESVLS